MGAVIKVGGSLAKKPETLKILCKKLSKIAEQHRLLIVPGGGEFADVVRENEKRFHVSAYAAHRMAVLGMEQFGLLLSELIPNAILVSSLERARSYWKSTKVPVFLPSKLLFREEPLEASWDVTSDSIAAFIATRVDADLIILVKDVDGVFSSDPKQNPKAKLIEKISVSALSKSKGGTCVDRYLPKLLGDEGLDCYVVSGLFPERIMRVIEGKRTTCTLIASK